MTRLAPEIPGAKLATVAAQREFDAAAAKAEAAVLNEHELSRALSAVRQAVMTVEGMKRNLETIGVAV